MKYPIEEVHLKVLAASSPNEICQRANCSYDAESLTYQLRVWNDTFVISESEQLIIPGVEESHYHDNFFVFLINYLQFAKNIEPFGEWISEKDLPGGVTFFRGPHLLPTSMISECFQNDLQAFTKRCLEIGGTQVDMGDAAFSFSITPSIPLLVIYWLGDEDFPAEAKILYDSSMRDYLPLDIVYALAVEACYRIGKSPAL